MFIFKPQIRENWDTFCYYESAFSDEECNKIVEMASTIPKIAAYTGLGADAIQSEDVRKSTISWIQYSTDWDWVYQKLYGYAMDANNARYGFSLHGYIEPLQFTEYGPSDHYKWHQDSGAGAFSIRKLSQVVTLSDEKDYEGGNLEFFLSPGEPLRKRGTVFCFPSFEVHRVSPVLTGTRRSLVSWITGTPFV